MAEEWNCELIGAELLIRLFAISCLEHADRECNILRRQKIADSALTEKCEYFWKLISLALEHISLHRVDSMPRKFRWLEAFLRNAGDQASVVGHVVWAACRRCLQIQRIELFAHCVYCGLGRTVTVYGASSHSLADAVQVESKLG